MSTMFRAARPHEMPKPMPIVPPAPVSIRRGRCTHVALCELATMQRVVELPDDEPFICPGCFGDLTPVLPRAGGRSTLVMVAQATVILLAVGGAGYRVWSELTAPPSTIAEIPRPPIQLVASRHVAAAPLVRPAIWRAPLPPVPVAAPVTTPPLVPVVLRVTRQQPVPDPVAGLRFPGPDTGLAVPLATQDVLFLPAAPPAAAPPPDAAQTLDDYLAGATRLPVTIRFLAGSARLDWRANLDLTRVAKALHTRHAASSRLVLAGFTDTLGSADDNEAMARRRASAVQAALTQRGLAPGRVASFGDKDPVGDNATSSGRAENRRVEVYLEK